MKINWNNAEFLTSYGKYNQIPPSERPEIAFSGRSNVGKSSLINKLLNRKSLARVSQMPGKTVTINFYKVDTIHIVDLPGYGYAKVSKDEKKRWTALIDGYLKNDREMYLVCQLIDFRHPPTADDLLMINFLIESGTPFIIVLTKADKLKKKERETRLTALQKEIPYAEQIKTVQFSAETGEGADELRGIIEELLDGDE